MIKNQKIEDFNQDFIELDEQLKKEQEKMNFDDALFICKKLIEVASSHEKADLIEKYSQLAEQIEIDSKDDNFRKVQEKLTVLEEKIKKEQEEKDLNSLLITCEEIINHAKTNDKPDIVEKYSQILKQVEIEIKGLEKKKDEFTVEMLNTIGEVSKLRDDGNFVEAIKKID